MRQIAFTPDAFKEYNDWFNDAEAIEKIKILVRDIDRDPFRGFGKPEPLKGKLERLLEQKNQSRAQTYLYSLRNSNHYCKV